MSEAYGPLESVNVQVEVYVPILALPGTFSAAVSADVDRSGARPLAASKILTAAGAVAPAGTVTG